LTIGAALLAAVALMAAVGCSQSAEARKQQAYERGQQYLKDDKLNEAIIEFRNALQIDPDFGPALSALGQAYADKSWFADARRELTRAQKALPDSVPVAVELGRVLIELADWAEAENQAAIILAHDPQNPQAMTIQAGALLGRGKLDEAVAALAAAPPGRIPEADRIRGDVLLRAGKVKEAEATYQTVLASKPNDLKSLLGLGAIALQRRQFDEARKFYEQAKAGHPLDSRSPVGLAMTMAQQGNLGDAIKELEKIDPRAQTMGAVVALGEYYLKANRADDAVRLLGPVVLRFPRVPEARSVLATALSSIGDSGAVRQLEELDRQVPDDPVIRLRLAAAYTQQGRPREALTRLDTIARQSGQVAAYQLERGRALLFLGRLDEALAAGSAAQRLAPRLPHPYVLVGQILAQRGNLKGAQEQFKKAAEVDASFAPAYLAAGRLHLTAKDPDAALRDFDAAMKADPRSLAAVAAKATTLVQQNRLKDAVSFVDEVIQSGKREAGFHTLLGNLYLSDGQRDKAAASFRQALETDPRNSPARFGLARVLAAEGRDEEAITQLQTAIKERPDDITSILFLRGLYDRLGRSDQMVPVLEAAVRANPGQLIFLLALCEVYTNVGRFEDAVDGLSEILKDRRDLPVAKLIRGQAYLGKGEGAAAIRDLQEVIQSRPKSSVAHFHLARAYALLGRKQEAEAEYREAIKLEPGFGLAKRGLAALRGGKVDEGILDQEISKLREITKSDPKNVIARESLARTYIERGQTKEAEAELRQLLALAPKPAEPNFLMAQILLGQNKEEEAVSHLRAALRGNPAHVGSNILMGRYLASKGQTGQAIISLEAALRVNPNIPSAQLVLARLYAESGRLPEALRLAQELQRVDPKAVEPRILTGVVLVAQQNPRAALEAFEQALKINARSVEAHRGVGQAYQLLGQFDKAEEGYRRALSLDGNDVTSLNDLAWILLEVRKKPEEALPLAVKAERLAPQLASVIDTLGWVHYRRQSYAEAEKLLARAVERAPSNAVIRFHLALAYAKLGRKNDAVSTLRRAAQLDSKLADRENITQMIKDLEG
jgi:tetratricopeptide (TPR) repeat protein